MKQTGILLTLTLTLAAAGCVELPRWAEQKAPPAETKPAPVVPVQAPTVTPQQVNENNAPKALNALREELDGAADERNPAPDRKP